MGVIDPGMDASQIEQRLLNDFRSARGGDTFTGNSAADLFYQIEGAAQRMITEGRTSKDDQAEAAKALLGLLNEMDAERTRLGYSEFREDTVSGALNNLCPGFWPFC
jgi:hypothetical protein